MFRELCIFSNVYIVRLHVGTQMYVYMSAGICGIQNMLLDP